MTVVKTHFDGQQIRLPDELRGKAPGEVTVIYHAATSESAGGSIWQAVGKAPQKRSADAIAAQLRQERDAWDAA